MDWKLWLVEWNRRYDIHKFGWLGACYCVATAVCIIGLGLLLAYLFPSCRHTIGIATMILCGFGVGFVYERHSGPLLLLLIFAVIFAVRAFDWKAPYLISIGWIALWIILPLVGFGFSYLVSYAARTTGQSNG
ncbi:MAG: hypothetical protein ABFD83_13100 [Armatimonadota bacterium]